MGKKKRKLEKEIKDSANKVWMAGLGALRVAEEEGSKLFQSLVAQGEKLEVKGKERLAKLKKVAEETGEKARETADHEWSRFETVLDERLRRVVEGAGVPTRDEIRDLSARVEELTKAVETLRTSETTNEAPAATRTTARKAAPRKTAPRKTTARKPTSRSTAKKAPAKKAPAKRAPAKRTASKASAANTGSTTAAKTSPARKPAAKKPAARKSAAKKPAAKTAVKKPPAKKPTRGASKPKTAS